jgi:tRNA intron endonuclease, catalytic C-terminal domain
MSQKTIYGGAVCHQSAMTKIRQTDAAELNEEKEVTCSILRGGEKESGGSITLSMAKQIELVRYYYQTIKGYPYVCCGLQFGVHLVLYADHPSQVHSDYCIYITEFIDWRTVQTLVRSMSDLHKSLILVQVKRLQSQLEDTTLVAAPSASACTNSDLVCNDERITADQPSGNGEDEHHLLLQQYEVIEIAITSEHAPFRQCKHRKQQQELSLSTSVTASSPSDPVATSVGNQRKKGKDTPQSLVDRR